MGVESWPRTRMDTPEYAIIWRVRCIGAFARSRHVPRQRPTEMAAKLAWPLTRLHATDVLLGAESLDDIKSVLDKTFALHHYVS